MTKPLDEIIIRRLFKASKETVFNAFSQPNFLTQWFSPSAKIIIEVLDMDFKIGGQYRFRYNMPDGTRPILGGTYMQILPYDGLSFSWVWEDPAPHANDITHVMISLMENNNQTELIIYHQKMPTEDYKAGHTEGWEGAFERLDLLLANTH